MVPASKLLNRFKAGESGRHHEYQRPVAKLSGWISPIGRRLEAIRVWVQPQVDRWLTGWKEDPDAPEPDFVQDADYFMIHQEPLRARILVKTVLISIALFFMWTAVAVVDEITKGEGKVIPSSQLQVLQSLDGGIVAEINTVLTKIRARSGS